LSELAVGEDELAGDEVSLCEVGAQFRALGLVVDQLDEGRGVRVNEGVGCENSIGELECSGLQEESGRRIRRVLSAGDLLSTQVRTRLGRT
jgi:hypothetical protein